MDIYQKVKKLKLPRDQYVVHAGSALEGHGIRKCGDIDIAATKNLYKYLKDANWKEIITPEGRKTLVKDNYEISVDFGYGDYQVKADALIKTAVIIKGVPFASLKDIIKLKKAGGREKDKKDLKLIKRHLQSQTK